MASKRSAQALGALLGSAEPAGAKGFDPQGELIKLVLKGAEEVVKPYFTSVGFGALDLHLRTMIDDPSLLAAESPELEDLYTDEVLAYLRANVTRMDVADFAADLGAQNLALRYLRKSDPTAWADYKARSEGLRSATKGYIRTTAGVTAFAALLAAFGQETLGAVRNKKGGEIILAPPFAWEFIREVPPLLKLSWQVGAAGVIELPMRSTRRFRVVEGGNVEEFGKVSEVVASIRKRNAETLMHEALFRTGADGLLYKLFRCDRSEVGRMLDTAVPPAQREKFASELALTDAPRFSFANAFNAAADNARERELGDEVAVLGGECAPAASSGGAGAAGRPQQAPGHHHRQPCRRGLGRHRQRRRLHADFARRPSAHQGRRAAGARGDPARGADGRAVQPRELQTPGGGLQVPAADARAAPHGSRRPHRSVGAWPATTALRLNRHQLPRMPRRCVRCGAVAGAFSRRWLPTLPPRPCTSAARSVQRRRTARATSATARPSAPPCGP